MNISVRTDVVVRAGVASIAVLALTGCQVLPGSHDDPERTASDQVVLIDDDATAAGPEPTMTWTLRDGSARQQVQNPRDADSVHDDAFDLTATEWREIQDRTEAYLAAEEVAADIDCTDTGSYTVQTSGWQSEKITRSDCGDISEKQELFEYVNDLATARVGPFVTARDQPRIRLGNDGRTEIEAAGTRLSGVWNGDPVEAELTADERADVDRALTRVLRSDESSCAGRMELEITVPAVRDVPWAGPVCRNEAGDDLLKLLDDLVGT